MRVSLLLLLLVATGAIASFFKHEDPLRTCLVDHSDKPADRVYDYIVVGAGSSGSVLASRLALGPNEDCPYRVLVIDAGGDQMGEETVEMPGLVDHVYDFDETSWPFYTEPEWFSNDIQIFYPRAHAYGGSSSHNNMVSVLATVKNTERWVNATGEQAWNYANRIAGFDAITAKYYKSFSFGAGSNINDVLGLPPTTPLPASIQAFIQTTASLGIPFVPPTARPGEIGDQKGLDLSFAAAIDKDTGKRSYSGEFITIAKAQCPTTYDSVMEGLVTKVLMEGRRAIGVEVLVGPNDYSIDPLHNATQTEINKQNPERYYATKKVILAGGFVNTPQLLKLSGIGPAAELESRSVDLVKELPGVGENWEDDDEFIMHFKLNETSIRAQFGCTETFNITTDPCYFLWKTYGKGPYALNAPGFGGFPVRWFGLNSTRNFLEDEPDCNFAGLLGVNVTSYDDYRINTAMDPYTVSVVLVMPQVNHRGTILLANNDPTEAPLMFSRYASDDEDMAAARRCIRRVRQIYSTPPFSEFVVAETRPGPQAQSDEDLDAFIREAAWNHHGGGTAKMGNSSDSTSVVDPRTRVWGTQNLAVCDYSIAPQIADFFPQTDAQIIGWICAGLYFEDDAEARPCAGEQHLTETRLNDYKRTHQLISVAGFSVWIAATILLGAAALICILVMVARTMPPRGYTAVQRRYKQRN